MLVLLLVIWCGVVNVEGLMLYDVTRGCLRACLVIVQHNSCILEFANDDEA